jgi:hypothetical protein
VVPVPCLDRLKSQAGASSSPTSVLSVFSDPLALHPLASPCVQTVKRTNRSREPVTYYGPKLCES